MSDSISAPPQDTEGEALARARWTPECWDCGQPATHACSYCGGVCDNCIDHCERFGHAWVVEPRG